MVNKEIEHGHIALVISKLNSFGLSLPDCHLVYFLNEIARHWDFRDPVHGYGFFCVDLEYGVATAVVSCTNVQCTNRLFLLCIICAPYVTLHILSHGSQWSL